MKRFVMKTLCCFGVMSIVVLGASDLLARDTDAMENFWQQNVRKLHFDLHTQADETELGNNFDPVDFADKMKRSGTQAVVFFCRGGRGHGRAAPGGRAAPRRPSAARAPRQTRRRIDRGTHRVTHLV